MNNGDFDFSSNRPLLSNQVEDNVILEPPDSLRSSTQSLGTSETLSESQGDEESKERKNQKLNVSHSEVPPFCKTQELDQKNSKVYENVNNLYQREENRAPFLEQDQNTVDKTRDEYVLSKSPVDWTLHEVIEWCQKIVPNFQEFQQRFVEHNITGQRLLTLTEEELKKTLKITKFAIYRKLSLCINKLREQIALKSTLRKLVTEKETSLSRTFLNKSSNNLNSTLCDKEERIHNFTIDSETLIKCPLSQQLPEYREAKKLKVEYLSQPATSSAQKSFTMFPMHSATQNYPTLQLFHSQKSNSLNSPNASSSSPSLRPLSSLSSSSSLLDSVPSSSIETQTKTSLQQIQLKAYLAFLDPVRLGRRIPLAYGKENFLSNHTLGTNDPLLVLPQAKVILHSEHRFLGATFVVMGKSVSVVDRLEEGEIRVEKGQKIVINSGDIIYLIEQKHPLMFLQLPPVINKTKTL
jgi:hypothetical protein